MNSAFIESQRVQQRIINTSSVYVTSLITRYNSNGSSYELKQIAKVKATNNPVVAESIAVEHAQQYTAAAAPKPAVATHPWMIPEPNIMAAYASVSAPSSLRPSTYITSKMNKASIVGHS